MRFDRVIILGSGKIASDCLNTLIKLISPERLIVIESDKNSLSLLQRICGKNEIKYIRCEKNDIYDAIIGSINNFNSLIISANNQYIFPKSIINIKTVEIINFHYALLPYYRGMNIPTWVIFNNEKITGITWHYVTEKIDAGNIIKQKTITLDDKITAYEIVQKGMILGIEAFNEFIIDLLNFKISGNEILVSENNKLYKNSELPMDGILDLNKSIEEIERLLRSYDYGRARILPKLKVDYLNTLYIIEGYSISDDGNSQRRKYMKKDRKLIIQEKGKKLVLILN